MKLREALQAFEQSNYDSRCVGAFVQAVRAALAAPVADEPAFWRYRWIHNSEARADVVTPNDGTTPPNRLGYTYPPEPLYTRPAAQEPVADEPVASVLPGALKRNQFDKDPGHWCHDALLYSPGSPHDSPENRVNLYTRPAAAPAERGEYPPLPGPDMRWVIDGPPRFNADQMRAYVDADRAQRVPLPADDKKPHAVNVPGYGYVDVKAVRAIERMFGIGAKP